MTKVYDQAAHDLYKKKRRMKRRMVKTQVCTDKVGLRKVSNIARECDIRVFHDKPWRKYKPWNVEPDRKKREGYWRNFLKQVKALLPKETYEEYTAHGRQYPGHALRVKVGT